MQLQVGKLKQKQSKREHDKEIFLGICAKGASSRTDVKWALNREVFMKKTSIVIVVLLGFLFAYAVNAQADRDNNVGRYQALLLPGGGLNKARVFIIDTTKGHLYLWSTSSTKSKGIDLLQYQGMVQPWSVTMGTPIDSRLYEFNESDK